MLASPPVERPTLETNDSSRPVEPAAGQPLLAFVHIPRTGGGTVSSAISKNYAPQRGSGNFQKSPAETRHRLANMAANPGQWKAIGDHVPYGLYRRYLPADTRYITFLRDPVDRVLSHYHFHARKGNPPGSAGPQKLKLAWEESLNIGRLEGGDGHDADIALPDDLDFSLEEGLERKIYLYDNFMTRFLWGGESLFGELPPDALERAKENLAGFWFVGISERLDDSIILLGRKLGVGLMPYWHRHVNPQRPSLEESTDDLRALIAEHNAVDVELYRFARDRFQESAPAPHDLAPEVEELRRLSIAVTAEGEALKASRPSLRAAKMAERKARVERRASARAGRAAKAASETQRESTPRARKPRRARGTEEGESSSPAGKQSEPLLAFVHIPRTGGGTVSSAIANGYSRPKSAGNAQSSPERTRRGVESIGRNPDRWLAVADHIPLGLYRRYLPADTRYFTILREPVDRVLSHYHFHLLGKRRGELKLRQVWQELANLDRQERLRLDESAKVSAEIEVPEDAVVSLEEGMARKICIYDNLATRFLWGGESIFGDLPPDALERAKENVAGLWFVGLAERLDDSIVLLGRRLGTGLMPYHRRHVSQKRPSLGDTPAELRELIAEHNALDAELYRFARELFEREAPAPDELAPEVDELRRLSAEATEAGETAREERSVQRLSRRGEKGDRQSKSRSDDAPEHAGGAALDVARPAASEGKPLLAFIRIPGTGGLTISSAISANYADQRGPGSFLRSPDATRGALQNIAANPWACQAVGDCVPFGLYLRYLPDDTRYVAVLRDPVERVIAHYTRHAHVGPARLKKAWEDLLNTERLERDGGDREADIVLADGDFSLEAGLRQNIVIYDNLMTRFLWGGDSLFGELPPDALDRAKQNILSLWFLGIAERIYDSLVLLGRQLGVGLMPHTRSPAARTLTRAHDTSPELRELIAEHNALDLELYRFAREYFDETAPAPDELAEDAEELRRLSTAITSDVDARRAITKNRRAARNGTVEGGEPV